MTAFVVALGAIASFAMPLPRTQLAPPVETLRGPRVHLVGMGHRLAVRSSLPVPASLVDVDDLRAPHHDYPASDLMVPTGTPVFAARPGLVSVHDGPRCGLGVTVRGDHLRRYTYCHMSRVSAHDGSRVRAGDVLGLSGDTGNARGVPHLHFHVRDASGVHLCPQPLFLAWYEGREATPLEYRITEGCSFPRAP